MAYANRASVLVECRALRSWRTCPCLRQTASMWGGHVSRGFEAVREAFVENFEGRRELGGACCAYHHGEKVVTCGAVCGIS
jgi:hypothetical protein